VIPISFLLGADETWVVGKTLAFTTIKFMNSKGDVFARGSHTKYVSTFTNIGIIELTTARYVALAWKDPNNIVEELSPKAAKE
jgi:acyl-coenzyme A thioesterase 13